MKPSFLMCCAAVCVLSSCGSDSGSSGAASSGTSQFKPLSQRLDEKNGYKADADGNWRPVSDKRSSFESKGASPYFKGGYQKKDFKTGEYAKQSWWGNKDYGLKQYGGNTDGSRFQQDSRFSGKSAREAGSSAGLDKTYQTDTYATHAAREAGKDGIRKTSDAETDSRRKMYTPPEIIDWKEQRAMNIEQSKSILGR